MKIYIWLALGSITSLYAMQPEWPQLTQPTEECQQRMKDMAKKYIDMLGEEYSSNPLFQMYERFASTESLTEIPEWKDAFEGAQMVHAIVSRDDITVILYRKYIENQTPEFASSFRKNYWNRIAHVFQGMGMKFSRKTDPSQFKEFFDLNVEFAYTTKNFATWLAAHFLFCNALTIASQ